MRILLIHNYYQQAGGEDTIFQTESELLASHGHVIERLAFDNKTIKTFFDKIFSGLRLIYNPASARALKKRIEVFNPDIIHVHNFVPIASPSIFFVAKKLNIPVVLTLHNYRLICPSATLFHNGKIYEKSIRSLFPLDAILKGVYRNSSIQTAALAMMIILHRLLGTWKNKIDYYLALSHFAKDKFVQSSLGLPENKFVIKTNSVSDRGVGDSVRGDFFLFVGRLTEEKGVRTLLQATKLYDFKLIIIGEGPLEDLVKSEAQSNSNIRFLGYLDRHATINYMKECRALIMPSCWYEGLPLTILEAFSTGTVVIASKLGTMAEIIQDGFNGLHFRTGNEKELVSKIAHLLAHDEMVKSISREARNTYLRYYTMERNYELLNNVYRKAIKEKQITHNAIVSAA
jgi:glycosyltransferase involved in cell wall biosynthesis